MYLCYALSCSHPSTNSSSVDDSGEDLPVVPFANGSKALHGHRDKDDHLPEVQLCSCSTSCSGDYEKDDDPPMVHLGSGSTACYGDKEDPTSYGVKEDPIVLDDSPQTKVLI